MKPLRLWAKNYGTWGEVDWLVPEGVTAILGRNEGGEGINSNGAGKTRLLELIPISLFGPQAPWSDYLTVGGAEIVCEVGCEFEHAGGVYRVRRTYSAAGRGKTTLDFERLDLADLYGAPDAPSLTWSTLTQERQDSTQQAIQTLLGCGEATFHQSVFASQGARHFADSDLTPSERATVLHEAVGLDYWEDRRQDVSVDRARIQAELDGLQAKVGDWQQQLAEREEVDARSVAAQARVVDLEVKVAAAKTTHDDLDGRYRAAREARTGVQAAIGERDALAAAAAALEQRQSDAVEAKTAAAAMEETLTDLQARAAGIAELEAETTRLLSLDSARSAAIAERDRLLADAQREREQHLRHDVLASGHSREASAKRARAATLRSDGSGVCEHCKQPLAGDALEASIAVLLSEADVLEAQATKAAADATTHLDGSVALDARAALVEIPDDDGGTALEGAKARLAVARAAELELASRQERRDGLLERAAIIEDPAFAAELSGAQVKRVSAAARVEELEASVVSEEEANVLARDALGARVAFETFEVQLGEARTEAGATAERSRTLAELAARSAKALGELNALSFDVEVLRELEKAYGRSGIPVLLLESLYIPKIERDANEILSSWGVPYTVELVTQKAQKTTEKLKDTLEVFIHEPRGVRRYQTYSGGERDRINVALMIGLARVIRLVRGGALDVFALDELAHLDAAGVDKLAELLRDLQREIPVVLFISHDSQLTDMFDQRVTVVREADLSRLEVAA